MLPKQAIELTDGFLSAFDLECSPERAFKEAHNKTAEFIVENGLGGWCGFALGPFAKELTNYVRKRAEFVSSVLQKAIFAAQAEPYPSFNTDVKLQFAKYLESTLRGAEDYFEKMRKVADGSPSFTEQARAGFNSIIARINAELDLFCAEYSAKQKRGHVQAGQVFNIQNVHGAVGNISESQVEVTDKSEKSTEWQKRNQPY